MDLQERVILVDKRDRAIGTEDKQIAHLKACRHRAVSVFVFDPSGALLLQQRAGTKYHSGGLWSNTCCGHPRVLEPVIAAARRRLAEEMGLSCPLRPGGAFSYRAAVPGGLWEHEYDHLFLGITDQVPRSDPSEVTAWEWVRPAPLAARLRDTPHAFTPWFPLAVTAISRWIWTVGQRFRTVGSLATGSAGSPCSISDATIWSTLSGWSRIEWPRRAGLRG